MVGLLFLDDAGLVGLELLDEVDLGRLLGDDVVVVLERNLDQVVLGDLVVVVAGVVTFVGGRLGCHGLDLDQ